MINILETFSWNDFRANRVAVQCPTKERALDFLRQCSERNIGVPFSMVDGYWLGEKTFYGYDFNYPEKRRVMCSSSYKPIGPFIYVWQYPLNHFTKSDLKTGMYVETRNGDRYMWFDGCCIQDRFFFNEIGEDLRDEKLSHPELDIMKVFTVNSPAPFNRISEDANLTLIWQRIEQ